VMLTLTASGQTHDKHQIELFLRKWRSDWSNEKLENQTEISW